MKTQDPGVTTVEC